jgi:hypothetical protein
MRCGLCGTKLEYLGYRPDTGFTTACWYPDCISYGIELTTPQPGSIAEAKVLEQQASPSWRPVLGWYRGYEDVAAYDALLKEWDEVTEGAIWAHYWDSSGVHHRLLSCKGGVMTEEQAQEQMYKLKEDINVLRAIIQAADEHLESKIEERWQLLHKFPSLRVSTG